MYTIDYWIVLIPLAIVIVIGLRTQRYLKGVSDFLTAGRVAGRYVVAVASGEAAMGLISLVAIFEMYYNAGFAINFWNSINTPIAVFLGLTGYCAYRFRETRAMTLGQFFEMRYSKEFRVFAAFIQSISGVVNYAIFPAVGGRFLIYYLKLPLTVEIFGLPFPTFGLMMAAFLGLAVAIVVFGGQVTIMVTDCVQGLLSYPMYTAIVLFVIWKFSWFTEIAPTLLDRAPGMSMLDPYDVQKLRDFNLFYIFVGLFSSIINRMAWSGTQGYSTAAETPHEQKMGGLLGSWRGGFSTMMYVLLAVAAYTYLNNKDFANDANRVRVELAGKAMEDVAPVTEKKFDKVKSEVNQYLKTGELSPNLQRELQRKMVYDLQANIDSFRKNVPNPKTEYELARAEAYKQLEPKLKAYVKTGVLDPELAKRIDKADQRGITRAALSTVDPAKAQVFGTIFGQMLVPMSIREMLPIGLTGIFCALMIFLLVSTDTTYMHSWGSIIVQDVILPFRKKPFTPRQQLNLLRLVIAMVAVVAFFFSLLFGQVDYIIMFFAITGAIWLGGAGPCITFGLYWRRGTTAGAFAALISGSTVAVSGFICQNIWASSIYPYLLASGNVEPVRELLNTITKPLQPYVIWNVTPEKFPINSQEIYFIAMLISIFLYVVISLLTCKEPFNMDRLLHRGKYQKEGIKIERAPLTIKTILPRLLGFDGQYTKWDKALAWSCLIWSLGYGFGSFLLIVIWNSFYSWPSKWWANWFLINNLIVPGVIAVISTIWFSIGGTWDLIRLFKRLDEKKTNLADDGRVIDHVSAEDLTEEKPDEGSSKTKK